MSNAKPSLIRIIRFEPAQRLPVSMNQFAQTPIVTEVALQIEFHDGTSCAFHGEDAARLEERIRALIQ